MAGQDSSRSSKPVASKLQREAKAITTKVKNNSKFLKRGFSGLDSELDTFQKVTSHLGDVDKDPHTPKSPTSIPSSDKRARRVEKRKQTAKITIQKSQQESTEEVRQMSIRIDLRERSDRMETPSNEDSTARVEDMAEARTIPMSDLPRQFFEEEEDSLQLQIKFEEQDQT